MYRITFALSQDLKPIGYTDSDWGGCRETRKFTSGYVLKISGGAVCWRSKKQSIVATSSFEAEYIASCSAAKEAVWLSCLIGDICNHEKPKPIRVFEDNQGSIYWGKNQAITQSKKHVDIHYHFVRDVVALDKVEFVHCPTKDMVADSQTKPLDRVKFEKLVKAMGFEPRNCPVPSIEEECWQ